MKVAIKVTTDQLAEIDAMRLQGVKYQDIAQHFGYGYGTVYRAHNRQDCRHVPASERHDFGAKRDYRRSIPFSVIPTIDLLIAGGHTFDEIAVTQQCGGSTIRNVSLRLGAYSTAPARAAQ